MPDGSPGACESTIRVRAGWLWRTFRCLTHGAHTEHGVSYRDGPRDEVEVRVTWRDVGPWAPPGVKKGWLR